MDRETEEMVCSVQAQLFAQRVALRALARTHPDPVALLQSWREALVEATNNNPVVPAHSRNSEYLAEQIRTYSEDITADLVELAVPAPGVLPI